MTKLCHSEKAFGTKCRAFSKLLNKPIINSTLLLVLFVLAGVSACSVTSTDFDQFKTGTAKWYSGDMWVHSDQSVYASGQTSIASLGTASADAGMDYIVLLDPSFSTGSLAKCSDLDAFSERLACISNPSNSNIGPEFPYWEQEGVLNAVGAALLPASYMLLDIAANATAISNQQGIACFVDHSANKTADVEQFAIVDHGDAASIDALHSQCMSLNGVAAVTAGSTLNAPSGDGIPVFLSDGDNDMLFGPAETEAIRQAFEWIASGHRITLIAGSGNRSQQAASDLSAGAELGGVRSSLLMNGLKDSSILSALRGGRTVIHGPSAFVDLGAYSLDGELLGTVGDEVVSDSTDVILRLRGNSKAVGALYVISIMTAEIKPANLVNTLFTMQKSEPKCTIKGCKYDVSVVHKAGEPMAYIGIIASSEIWNHDARTLPWKDIAISSPIYLR